MTYTEACSCTLRGGSKAESPVPYPIQGGQMRNDFVGTFGKIARLLEDREADEECPVTAPHKTALFQGNITGHSARTRVTAIRP